MALDQNKLNRMLGQVIQDIGAVFHAPLVLIGEKLGLFKALAEAAGPLTPEELAVHPANVELLRSIAEAAGGQYDPEPADVFAPTARTAPITIRLWSYFLVLGAILFVFDLYLKRHELGAKR